MVAEVGNEKRDDDGDGEEEKKRDERHEDGGVYMALSSAHLPGIRSMIYLSSHGGREAESLTS